MKLSATCSVATVSTALLVSAAHLAADFKPTENYEAVRYLKLDYGRVMSVEHFDAPDQTVVENGKVVELHNLAPRTLVKVMLTPAPKSYIRVVIGLPAAAKWNGRFLGGGNGGSAGQVLDQWVLTAVGSGAAYANTDMGTAPGAMSGDGNPEIWKDFGYRATHLMTVVAKEVIKAFYGKYPDCSYFNGGSTGGQQAFMLAQRYPEDYDGIIANVPAHTRVPLHAYFLWNHQIIRNCPFTKEQMGNIVKAGREYRAPRECPVIAHRAISDPRHTPEEAEEVIQLARKMDPSLTDAHAEALRKLFDGPRQASTGERIFNGIPFGCDLMMGTYNLYLWNWVFGKGANYMKLNFDKDFERYFETLSPDLDAEYTDLSAFAARGGKFIITAGAQDSCVPFHSTMEYYDRLAARCGGHEKAGEFCRLFIIPGWGHGAQNVRLNVNVQALVQDWREKGVAPEKIGVQFTDNGEPTEPFPVYPYPLQTVWHPETRTYSPVAGPVGVPSPMARRFQRDK